MVFFSAFHRLRRWVNQYFYLFLFALPACYKIGFVNQDNDPVLTSHFLSTLIARGVTDFSCLLRSSSEEMHTLCTPSWRACPRPGGSCRGPSSPRETRTARGSFLSFGALEGSRSRASTVSPVAAFDAWAHPQQRGAAVALPSVTCRGAPLCPTGVGDPRNPGECTRRRSWRETRYAR